MDDNKKGGLVDLEKELTCSICTDILYQPLTLLDCLHTFCGSCLKEWFRLQASSARTPHPYTCPSCRASVRETRPNATVTTLLDMFLQANPDRGRSEDEKQGLAQNYKPGDNVLPKVRASREYADDDDRRVVESIQELSLREAGISTGRLDVTGDERRTWSLESRGRSDRHHRTAASSNRRQGGTYLNYRPDRDTSDQSPSQAASHRRQVEHQASLRSLLSASDVDSQEIEEEIMRQIMEEGLLDGIDLTNIDVSQDEITDRIAQAYRRRQRQRERDRERDRGSEHGHEHHRRGSGPSRGRRESGDSPSSTHVGNGDQGRRRQNPGSDVSTREAQHAVRHSSRPPVSRPHLLESGENSGQRERRHRRASSQGSTPGTYRAEGSRRRSEDAPAAASRSSTDPPERPRTSEGTEEAQARVSRGERRGNGIEGRRGEERTHLSAPRHDIRSSQSSPRRSAGAVNLEIPSINEPAGRHSRSSSQQSVDALHTHRRPHPANNSSPALVTLPSNDEQTGAGNSRQSDRVPDGVTRQPTLFVEPSVSCNRCGTTNLQYDLHYNCVRCDSGEYNLCLRCYRSGKGCRHWYGFGYAAWAKYERQAPPEGYPSGHEKPHILIGRQYTRPNHEPTSSVSSGNARLQTEEDPAKRLRAGVFCDICSAFANACYWRCDFCNEGAWGYCNNCVNQGRHCTHPLLPLTHKGSQRDGSASEPAQNDGPDGEPPEGGPPTSATSSYAVTPKSASLIRGPATTPITIGSRVFRPLTFSVDCDNCRYPIPPSNTRFHCQICSAGDYDLCKSCYYGMVATGKISGENGHHGWRRCPRGHRMVVVGFEDRDGGQRRVVVNDLVGGLALKDDGADAPAAPPPAAGPAEQFSQDRSDPAAAQQSSPGLHRWSWRDGNTVVQKSRGQDLRSSLQATSGASASAAEASSAAGPSADAAGTRSRPRFPPDGGVGLRVVALWGYFPADGVTDELMFPKGAEIREAEDINGDWFWGRYAGAKGLFPGNYGRVVK